MTGSENTDKAVGLTTVFTVLTILGAIVMLVGAPEKTASYGFALALLFGTLAILTVHLYGSQ